MIDLPPRGATLAGALRALAPWLVAGAVYAGLGVLEPRLLLSWAEGIGFAFVAVWALPALVRRLRKRQP
jgi:hypothetical protein